jgi:hypothetical protein
MTQANAPPVPTLQYNNQNYPPQRNMNDGGMLLGGRPPMGRLDTKGSAGYNSAREKMLNRRVSKLVRLPKMVNWH